MWIVRLALRRPYTFVVASILVFILGIVAIVSMPTDVFPVVDIPVIAVCYNYTGMSPQDMNARIITPFERILSTTVNDVAHIESQSLYGIGVVKIYFQPNANIYNSNAQVTAIGQTFIRQAPPGTQPPLDHRVQRQQRAGGATVDQQQNHSGTKAVRLGFQLHAPAADHRAGRADPLSVRRQAAAGCCRFESRQDVCLRHFSQRCQQRHQCPESDPCRPARPRSASRNTRWC